MAKAGLPLGTFFQLWAAVVSLYTLWLLSNLYQEFKRNSVRIVCHHFLVQTLQPTVLITQGYVPHWLFH
jgi:hypothetical protein